MTIQDKVNEKAKKRCVVCNAEIPDDFVNPLCLKCYDKLEESIKTQIDQYVSEAKDYKIKPEVYFGKEDGYDYCIIDILINDQKTFGILVK